jgi:hypothetical protein
MLTVMEADAMEKKKDEKTWDDFWTTGKVADYLSYKNSLNEGTVTDTKNNNEGRSERWDNPLW